MNENENISRSTIFRNKMKIEAAKRQEQEELSRKPKINKSVYFYSDRRTRLPEKNIGKEPGE